MTNKKEIRKSFLKKRKSISVDGRNKASCNATKQLLSIATEGIVLSFVSMENEIDLAEFNSVLALGGRLALPCTFGAGELAAYIVSNLQTELVKNDRLSCFEPNRLICTPIELSIISIVIVPGVVFDRYNNRYGYGKGLYDRLLNNQTFKKIGVGFKEQFYSKRLVTEPHDIPLDEVYLF